jgi:hypothetical protein
MHLAQHHLDASPFLHGLAFYLYITTIDLNMGKPMGRNPISIT